MSLLVRKSSPVVVRPSPEPATTRGTVKLSSFDMGLYDMPTTSLLVFENHLHNAAETIQGALSRALAYYYPVAGRIVARGGGSDDDIYIDCNGEGVEFVAASASQALKEVICFDDLAVYYPDMACGPGDPLLLMQVTEFSCGGFVLGVTWNHGVADGAGIGQFLKAVGELAGGLPSPSVAPVRWDHVRGGPRRPVAVPHACDRARPGDADPARVCRRRAQARRRQGRLLRQLHRGAVGHGQERRGGGWEHQGRGHGDQARQGSSTRALEGGG